MNKNIYICFRENDETYLYLHDELLNKIPIYKNQIPAKYKELLEAYKL